MDTTSYFLEILKIIGPALWILPAIYFFFLNWRRQERTKLMMEQERLSEERKRLNYERHMLGRDSERDERYSPRMLEEIASRLSRLDATIDERLAHGFSAQLNAVITEVSKTLSNRSVGSSTADDHEITRDLSHALNTPLSQIEAATSTALATPGVDHEESLKSILVSVQICKAFLGAYRELNSISSSSSVWSPSSLREAVVSAGAVYAAKTGKRPKLEVELPESIPGYSNSYVTALLLPLLENAIESSKPGTSVTVNFGDGTDRTRLVVANESEDEPGGEEIYEEGYSTKLGHDGTGLSSVRYLLRGHRGATIDHNYTTPRATFEIALPRRGA